MAKTEASLKDIFNKLRGEADDRDLLVVVSNLSSLVKRFLAANEEAVRTEQSKGEIIATRTVKAAADVAHLMEETVAGAQKDATISKDEVMSDTERANRINLIMAIVVVLSLIASVVFSFLGVARPMTRLERCVGQDGRRRSRRRDSRRRPRRRNRAIPRQDGDRHSRERRAQGARGSGSQGRAGPGRGAAAQGRK